MSVSRNDIRKENRNDLYRVLSDQSEYTVSELAVRNKLSVPTAAQYLKELIAEGLAEEAGSIRSTGGRSAKTYIRKKDARLSVGIDITQNHIIIAVIDLAGDIICISEREKFSFEDTDECCDQIVDKLSKFLTENCVELGKILGVGVSVPCIVDPETDKVIYGMVVQAPEDLKQKFECRLSWPVVIFNDANAAGNAEIRLGKSSGCRGMTFYLMLSNSVGGAIIHQNSIYAGANGRSSEIGHMRIVPNGRMCYCGQRGCVDSYCSAKILSNRTEGNLQRFFEEVDKGDLKLRKVLDEYLRYLAVSIVNIRMLFDGDIILGGYVGPYLENYLGRIQELVKDLNPFSKEVSYLHTCTLQTEASTLGAAMFFIDRFIDEI